MGVSPDNGQTIGAMLPGACNTLTSMPSAGIHPIRAAMAGICRHRVQ
jgi:hypothetical protein